jgi:hypothetical protein
MAAVSPIELHQLARRLETEAASRKCPEVPRAYLVRKEVVYFPENTIAYYSDNSSDRVKPAHLMGDNVFLQVSDLVRAQRLADGFASLDWVRVLDRYAQRINPLLGELLGPMLLLGDVAVRVLDRTFCSAAERISRS